MGACAKRPPATSTYPRCTISAARELNAPVYPDTLAFAHMLAECGPSAASLIAAQCQYCHILIFIKLSPVSTKSGDVRLEEYNSECLLRQVQAQNRPTTPRGAAYLARGTRALGPAWRKKTRFVFVALTGYRDVPQLDEDGQPIEIRTTPLHRVALRETSKSSNVIPCKYGLIDVVRKFLELREDADIIVTETGDSPLKLALLGNHRDVVELLLRQTTVEINAWDRDGDTPLIIALRYHDWKLAERLLQQGANPNLANVRGVTPLHEILLKDKYNLDTECLVERFFMIVEDVQRSVQVNVNAQDKDRGDTPLHLALRRGNKKEAEFLLSRGANPNLVNATGKTAMFIVCNRWSNEDELLELAEMVFESSEEQFKPLQLNVQDERGETALFRPLRRGEKQLVKLLLERGIDPNLANVDCEHALHQSFMRNYDVDMVRLIFEHSQERYHPLRINAQMKGGLTPLHVAALWNKHEVVEFLLRRGADPNIANDHGETSVHHLCNYDHKPELFSRAQALFEICAENGQSVRIDAQDNDGSTPLQWAVARHSPMIVDLLLDRGADLSSFVFPTESYFNAGFRAVSRRRVEKKFILASGMLAVVERLTARGYELYRSDALTIMKIFPELNMFENSADLENNWYDDEEFATQAEQTMINLNLSLYDLIQLRPDEARRRLSSMEYYEFARTLNWLYLPERLRDVCARHLCEKLSRRFFLSWALDPFIELIHNRLPILCCDMILDVLMNRDLHNICLAAC
ncbi:unnamed protein product [Trichogramma brassicae]|uniref:Uncharacterized protein n=1 Tax=Trichogramma brassicae TaxID=86971 RepID=A0A6H5J3W0_9HYME|nr:unnamed protein product [Trichogramma brassicae]